MIKIANLRSGLARIDATSSTITVSLENNNGVYEHSTTLETLTVDVEIDAANLEIPKYLFLTLKSEELKSVTINYLDSGTKRALKAPVTVDVGNIDIRTLMIIGETGGKYNHVLLSGGHVKESSGTTEVSVTIQNFFNTTEGQALITQIITDALNCDNNSRNSDVFTLSKEEFKDLSPIFSGLTGGLLMVSSEEGGAGRNDFPQRVEDQTEGEPVINRLDFANVFIDTDHYMLQPGSAYTESGMISKGILEYYFSYGHHATSIDDIRSTMNISDTEYGKNRSLIVKYDAPADKLNQTITFKLYKSPALLDNIGTVGFEALVDEDGLLIESGLNPVQDDLYVLTLNTHREKNNVVFLYFNIYLNKFEHVVLTDRFSARSALTMQDIVSEVEKYIAANPTILSIEGEGENGGLCIDFNAIINNYLENNNVITESSITAVLSSNSEADDANGKNVLQYLVDKLVDLGEASGSITAEQIIEILTEKTGNEDLPLICSIIENAGCGFDIDDSQILELLTNIVNENPLIIDALMAILNDKDNAQFLYNFFETFFESMIEEINGGGRNNTQISFFDKILKNSKYLAKTLSEIRAGDADLTNYYTKDQIKALFIANSISYKQVK